MMRAYRARFRIRAHTHAQGDTAELGRKRNEKKIVDHTFRGPSNAGRIFQPRITDDIRDICRASAKSLYNVESLAECECTYVYIRVEQTIRRHEQQSAQFPHPDRYGNRIATLAIYRGPRYFTIV